MEMETEARSYYRYDEICSWPVIGGWSVCPDNPRYHVCVCSEAYIYPSVLLGSEARVEAGAAVKAGAVVGCGAKVGAGVRVESGAVVESEAVVESGEVVGVGEEVRQ